LFTARCERGCLFLVRLAATFQRHPKELKPMTDQAKA
jgi:hypothetical protein